MVDDTVALLELLRDRFGRQDLRRRVLLRRHLRRPGRCAAPRPRGGTGGDRHGHRHARRREPRLRLRTRHCPPSAATSARCGSWKPSARRRTWTLKPFTTRARWVAELRRRQRPTRTTSSLLRALVGKPLRSPDYTAVDLIRALRGISASQAALLPQLATTDLVRTVPRLDVPIVMAQGRLDQVAYPATRTAVLRLARRHRTKTGLVRVLRAHPPPRRTRQVPRPAHERQGQQARHDLTSHRNDRGLPSQA